MESNLCGTKTLSRTCVEFSLQAINRRKEYNMILSSRFDWLVSSVFGSLTVYSLRRQRGRAYTGRAGRAFVHRWGGACLLISLHWIGHTHISLVLFEKFTRALVYSRMQDYRATCEGDQSILKTFGVLANLLLIRSWITYFCSLYMHRLPTDTVYTAQRDQPCGPTFHRCTPLC